MGSRDLVHENARHDNFEHEIDGRSITRLLERRRKIISYRIVSDGELPRLQLSRQGRCSTDGSNSDRRSDMILAPHVTTAPKHGDLALSVIVSRRA